MASPPPRLAGKHIALLAATGIHEHEFWVPYYRLKEEDASVMVCGVEKDSVYLRLAGTGRAPACRSHPGECGSPPGRGRPRTTALLALGAALLMVSPLAQAAPPPAWVATVRRDHPRLFFNRDTFPAVRARALGADEDWYGRMKGLVDGIDAPPKQRDWGREASLAAFIWHVTRDRAYLDKARALLEQAAAAYTACAARGDRDANWFSWSRICAWTTLDWLWNDLPPETRKRIGAEFAGLRRAVCRVACSPMFEAPAHPCANRPPGEFFQRMNEPQRMQRLFQMVSAAVHSSAGNSFGLRCTSNKEMTRHQLAGNGKMPRVVFETKDARTVDVRFAATGPAGGHIRIAGRGLDVNRALTQDVQPQCGFTGNDR